ncbi:hypothetical protein [Streptomyces beijiangensis]|uniref:Lipoprotein n=1 Tax=Streptomyces beijiangensis TaxID=163361 RepID=A0A939FG96_9ACTN|nr:hypothetical protein [Streptomyces beijiangensis]MBO0516555.1 hypothetical protein [Streptomyces beijiangensis]
MSDLRHRRLGIIAGAVLLPLTVAGCSGMGRSAVGTISYTTEKGRIISETSPSVRGCHVLLGEGGATTILNNTLVDLVMYPNADCTGKPSAYSATTLTNRVSPSLKNWHSFTIVH